MLALLEGEDRAQAGRGCGGWLMEGGLTSAEREGGREAGSSSRGAAYCRRDADPPTLRPSVRLSRLMEEEEEECKGWREQRRKAVCSVQIDSYLFCMC